MRNYTETRTTGVPNSLKPLCSIKCFTDWKCVHAPPASVRGFPVNTATGGAERCLKHSISVQFRNPTGQCAHFEEGLLSLKKW